MGESIFDVELFHAAYSDRHPIVALTLPAAPWEMADAMDALRLGEGERMVVEVLDSHDFDCVDLFIAAEDNIYALNVLAQRLSELNDGERAIFRGAVKIEAQKDGSIDLMKLIDLAFSTDSYNVAPDVRNDGQLGRFYAEGGFVPETDGLTDAQFELLDFAKIGRRMRESEDGTFCDVGYVVRTGEIVDVSRAIEFKPEAADYAVLLETGAIDTESRAMLRLPASPAELDRTLDILGVEEWSEVSFRCADCRAPMLRDAISTADSIAEAKRAAAALERLPEHELCKYKAVLSARGVADLTDAVSLIDTLDDYVFSPEFASYEDVGRSNIRFLMDDDEADVLLPYVRLTDYGKASAEYDHMILTGYGGIERRDGQPILTQDDEEQKMDEMSFA